MKLIYKKRILKVFTILIMVILITQLMVVNVNAVDNKMEHYENILTKFNEEYQTHYIILSPDQAIGNSSDINAEYEKILSMSDDEFWSYIYNAHFELNNYDNMDSSQDNDNIESPKNTEATASTVSEQRHYYDKVSSRYVYFRAQIVNVEGYRYDTIVSRGSVHNSYPAREATTYEYIITNSGKKVVIEYHYKKLLSQLIMDTGNYTARVSFTAGGGDVWGA